MQRLDPQAQQTLLELAVAEFAAATRFPLAFGGFDTHGTATMTALFGHRTLSLQGLCVQAGRGLGGRALAEHRPRLTMDYRRSRHITHDYDAQVLGEGIVALFAHPVIVDGETRAVLYGGTREATLAGSAFARSAAAVVTDLAREIRRQDEVEQRAVCLAARLAVEQQARHALPGPALEALRSSHAELRSIAAAVADPTLRARLAEVDRRLTTIETGAAHVTASYGPGRSARSGDTPHAESVSSTTDTGAPPDRVHLTPRELDVISHAALGGTNAEIARALGLTESTIKSYVKTAMSKLQASTRHAAVAAARRHGLIP